MSKQNVNAVIMDRNGNVGLDSLAAVREGGVGLWQANTIKQMDGDSYITSWYNAAVAAAGVLDLRIVTAAARKVHFNIDAQNARVRMQIYENPAATGGTLLAAVPPNFSANLAANFVWHTPVVTAVGALHFDGVISNIGDYIYTFQASAAGFSYLIRLTNMSGAVNDIAVNLETFI